MKIELILLTLYAYMHNFFPGLLESRFSIQYSGSNVAWNGAVMCRQDLSVTHVLIVTHL